VYNIYKFKSIYNFLPQLLFFSSPLLWGLWRFVQGLPFLFFQFPPLGLLLWPFSWSFLSLFKATSVAHLLTDFWSSVRPSTEPNFSACWNLAKALVASLSAESCRISIRRSLCYLYNCTKQRVEKASGLHKVLLMNGVWMVVN
jgi:hypothetical protein